MNILIKQSVRPQASKLSFFLLALVILGFGVFAQTYTTQPEQIKQTAQSISATVK